jgi:hypothetical protein
MVGIERTGGHISHIGSVTVSDTQATDIEVCDPTPSIATLNTSVVRTVADREFIHDLSLEGGTEALGETEVRGEEVIDGIESGAEHE